VANANERERCYAATRFLALADKPSFAVLPFQNMSGDPDPRTMIPRLAAW
jgi:TolB-like protein